MFKYLKTLNTEFHPTVVEFLFSEKITDYPDQIARGSLVTINGGKVGGAFSTARPMYLTLNGKEDDETKYIKCIRLSRDMVLFADLSSEVDKSQIFVGTLLAPAIDIDDKVCALCIEGEPKFEVLDISEIDNGKVTVAVI